MGKMFDALNKVEREKLSDLRDDFSTATREDIVFDEKLISFFQPSSTAAEQFRRLRTYIIKAGDDKFLRTILVTSAVAGEGKSLIALNLAITIATEFHNHALLVDCDLRSPSISRLIGLQEKKGISDYLIGNAELPDLLLKTPVEKLSVLGAGGIPENPVELIGSKKMKSFIQDIKRRYDDRYIIIDSSPVLATTEPSVLNELVDGILLVVKASDTPRESVQQAIKLLKKNKILGIVLNNLEFKTQALIRRYFGANRYYDEYQYANTPTESGAWRKKIVKLGKMFLS